jgi:hypothetical protein
VPQPITPPRAPGMTVEELFFHFQQNQPLQHLPVIDIMYAHQMWVYISGVYHLGGKNVSLSYV